MNPPESRAELMARFAREDAEADREIARFMSEHPTYKTYAQIEPGKKYIQRNYYMIRAKLAIPINLRSVVEIGTLKQKDVPTGEIGEEYHHIRMGYVESIFETENDGVTTTTHYPKLQLVNALYEEVPAPVHRGGRRKYHKTSKKRRNSRHNAKRNARRNK